MNRILLVEDDSKISELIVVELSDQGFTVDTAQDGESGLQKLNANEYALAILDIMLPKMSGLEICKTMRHNQNSIPIILLTAKREEIDRVLGLELGADDYLCKPFSIHELLARVRAVLRRTTHSSLSAPKTVIREDTLVIDCERRTVHLKGEVVTLTAREFDLLEFLATNKGRPFTREQLLEEIWGYTTAGYENNINTHVNRLRKKLEPDPANPRFIRTLRGFGYYFGQREE